MFIDFILLVRLTVNSRILVVKFLGSYKLYVDLHGRGVVTPALLKRPQYSFLVQSHCYHF